MRIAAITIFPEIFRAYMGESIMKRALEKGLVRLDAVNPRDFAADRHRTVDDCPYGGGPGMVMKPEPLAAAIESVKADGVDTLTIMLTPQGRPFNQRVAEELSRERRRLLFVCGRYEAMDDRVREAFADDEISTGDYVLTGGELPALVIIDAVVRLLPGVLGDEESLREESFSWGILDYPHYTRPPEWRGTRVPEVLLSGNHAEIARWRRKEALRRTLRRRPDLLELASLSEEDRKLIRIIKEEES
ncbi:MAG: tRNA (guanosine(37)-N1)-methyltransferase TrmD [Thermodesulfovibrionales bacterium]